MLMTLAKDKFTTRLDYALKQRANQRYGDAMWQVESAGPPHTKEAG